MSLLLDALKRAEESKRAKQTDKPDAAAAIAQPVEAAKPIELMVEETQDQAYPLNQTSAPLVPATAPSGASDSMSLAEPALMPLSKTPPTEQTSTGKILIVESRDEEAERQAVKNSFIAKQSDDKSGKRKWLLPVIAVILLLVGAGGWYFRDQLYRYKTVPLAAARPQPAAANPATAAATSTASASNNTDALPQVKTSTGQLVNTPPAEADAATGKKVADAASPAPLLPPLLKEVASTTAKKSAGQKSARTSLANEIKEASAARQPAVALKLATSIVPSQPDADLMSAYEALRTGDYATAQKRYRQLIDADPFSLDAQIGMAAAAARRGDRNAAVEHYRRTLEIDPRNATAIAGLATLNAQSSPAATEVELKTLIAKTPTSAGLQFSLGNLYAAQKRWSEAQQAYFEAYRLESGNADFAFNLAVSLDQLSQPRLALEYYQTALALAAKSATQFDATVVKRRAEQLSATSSQK